MDPNATLADIRALIGIQKDGELESYQVDRLCDLVDALDEWIIKGGLLPKTWQPSR